MRRKMMTVLAVAGVLVMLSGCGGSSAATESMTADKSAAMDSIYMSAGNTEMAAEDTVAEEDNSISEETGKAQAAAERKLIKNIDLSVETEDLDALLAGVEKKVTELGGYMESYNLSNGSSYYAYLSRSANLTIRIPATKVDQFVSGLEEASNVVSRNEQIEDVTLQYVDLASHKEALLTEQTRLLELMEQAETMEDIIALESRLSEVRYQIESMESQLRTFDNQVSYSTVYLYIDEVETFTQIQEQTAWQRITTGFVDSLQGVGHGMSEFGIWLLVNLPYLFLWALVIALIVVVIRAIIRRKHRKNTEKKVEQNG